ncbi:MULTISPECIES: TonB-dependent receptor [Xanthomonas]|uniref:TonB-dependent receptor n=1 Tax=Xanthomonas cucurbitae TaxID=56453 RepID=A0ABY7YC17_9XANT|nr:TonB-dependent receptor [Xanthomonas cucurbitae]QHG85724.1 TonB-dependent receptor [Xanthomonas cucurbitae]WDM67538.1 TonB-dependent receptor [Xanthomonas cucurbitae]WDM71414.1 TonB-dependent receptor [Xanthomonas cucurbitae]WDM75609.1 TonB-dependent receptor [Xanthomonas cucurbitae]
MARFRTRPSPRFCLLALGVGISLSAHATGPGPGPSGPPGDTPVQLDAVQVSGQHLSIRQAIGAKREAAVVSDGVAADDIGSIPDFGLGEALQRVPGVSMVVNNGRGEAQFMSLRGFNPDYNTVLIDGVALPSTETSRRVQSLDVIPASLAQQVDIYKTFNADMDSNAIGGIASLRTRSAFDHDGPFASVRANVADWENRRHLQGSTPSGQVQGTFSDTFGPDNRFGVVLSADYFRRDSSSLNTAIDSYSYYANGVRQNLTPGLDTDGMAIAPDRFRPLSYDNLRQRRSVFGKLEYDDGQVMKLALSAGWFEHSNDEQRRSQWINRVGNAQLADADDGRYAQGSAQTDANRFDQTRTLRYAQLGGSFRLNQDGHVDVLLNRANGSYRQDTREDVFTAAASTRLGFGYALGEDTRPTITLVDPGYYANPANYLQSYFLTRVENSSTDTTTFNVDYSQNADADAQGWGLRAGLHYRDLQQRYNLDETRLNPAGRVSLATVGTDDARICPYADFSCLLLVDPARVAAFAAASPGAYVLATTNARNSAISDFRIDERSGAAYVMGTWHGERTQATLGLRNEYLQRQVRSAVPQPLSSTTNYVQQSDDSDRRFLLPSANLGWDITPALKLRLAGSRTVGLPTYGDIGQNSSPVVDTTGLTINRSIANPQLRPRRSDNLDLSLEWYPDQDSQLSVALFHKRIDNEIVRLTSTDTERDPGGLVGTYEVTTTQAINTGAATVQGVEFTAIDTRFDFLPGAWSHLGAMANLTLLDPRTAQVQMSDGSLRALPGLMESPKRSANASLLYDIGPFSARLSANYTGLQLLSAATDNRVNDRYYDAITSYDAQLAWRFNKQLRLTMQGRNVSNARLTRVIGADQQLMREQLDNGRAYYLGVDYAF